MQLYALNDQDQLVLASEAIKQSDYSCVECGKPLRVRHGDIRQHHFYHITPNQKCSLHQKSLKHLQVQWHLQTLLENCQLEWRFPEIQRIADVVWFTKKIVFEVQCSPIYAKEIIERNRDYRSIGYEVVWILHDSRFNRWRLTAAEAVLEKSPHYFTNIDRTGGGMIYDTYAYVKRGIRHEVGSPYVVNLKQLVELEPVENQLPRLIQERIKHWSLHFKGDLVDRRSSCKAALQIEEKWDCYFKEKEKKSYFYRLIILPYLFLFRYAFDSVVTSCQDRR